MALDLTQSIYSILSQGIGLSPREFYGPRLQLERIDLLSQSVKQLQEQGGFPKVFENPLVCQLELTYRCNLRCMQCYNRSGDDSWEDTELDRKEWLLLANQIAERGVCQCIISGGEPLLLGDLLFDIMDIFHAKGVAFIFITNGYLVNKEVIERLKAYRFFWVQISIDGATAEVHDQVRGVPGSWQRATEAALLVNGAGLPLEIAHTITRQNCDTLKEMVELAYLLGAGRLVADRYLPSGRGAVNHEKLSLTEGQKKEIYQILLDKYFEYLGRMEVIKSMGAPESLKMNTVSPPFGFIIRPNGDVRLDCILPFTMGNLRRESFEEVWARVQRVHEDSRLKEYIAKVNNDDDLLKAYPVPYVDEDILID